MSETIINKQIEDELKQSFLEYAMSVIVSRALPDVRDGLKPVHRRILYSMLDQGVLSSRPTKKCARIVGDVMGKYHPHGDSSIYEALVRMGQDFSMRYTLIRPQGNFGSIDGDPPAAMRYTEAKLKKIAEDILEDIKKDTVDFIPNYDGQEFEPSVLPAKIPNLLVNGVSGIAVGMATNIPPHNIKEICEAVITLVDNPELSFEDLCKIVKGPDFPTGGIITGLSGLRHAYATGNGKIIVKGKTHFEKIKDRDHIIITEIPYMVNKSLLIEDMADLVKQGKISEISDLRDESDKDGMRIVVILKNNANPEIVLNQLMKHSRLRNTFGANMVALDGQQPNTFPLKTLLTKFIDHRREIVTRRTQFELKQAKEKAHKLEGLKIALDNLEEAIEIIKAAKNPEEASSQLKSKFSMSEIQARTVLEMRLQRLTGLEQEKIRNDLRDTMELIANLEFILSDVKHIHQIIKKETMEVSEKYGDERRTEIIPIEDEEILIEDLIEDEQVVVTITTSGYVKRTPLETYKTQRRGGVGVKGAGMKSEDVINDLFTASAHSYLLCITNKGKLHWLKVYQIPEGGRTQKGKAIVNLLNLGGEEKVQAIVPVKEFTEDKWLMFATKKGTVKRTALNEYSNIRKGGIIALTLEEGDELLDVKQVERNQNIVIGTKLGSAVRFPESEVRQMGRTAKGVRGINLRPNDEVIGMITVNQNDDIFTITNKGFGKRTPASEYRLTARGGKGVTNIKLTSKNGYVIGIASVTDAHELLFITSHGILIRTSASGISRIGRATQGVRVMKLRDDDYVVNITKVIPEDQINGDGGNTMKDEEQEYGPEEYEDTEKSVEEDFEDDEIEAREEAVVLGLEEDKDKSFEEGAGDIPTKEHKEEFEDYETDREKNLEEE